VTGKYGTVSRPRDIWSDMGSMRVVFYSDTVLRCESRSKRSRNEILLSQCTPKGRRILMAYNRSDGNHPTRTIYLHVLRQGQPPPPTALAKSQETEKSCATGLGEAHGGRDMELLCVQKSHRWGRLDSIHDGRRHCSQVRLHLLVPAGAWDSL
jgi:hypothetical protein